MNHYPHHLGDYLKDTFGLTQGEHGAYLLLMFAAYSSESGIDPEEVYAITKAASPLERKNTDRVLAKYWTLAQDGLYHQRRIDEEVADYQAKAAHNRRVGMSGGRPKRNPTHNPEETRTVFEKKPEHKPRPEPESKPKANPEETLAISHKPRELQNLSQANASDDGKIGGLAVAAALALGEAKIDTETPAAYLASVCLANGIRASAFHPLVVEWARNGVTIEGLKAAIAKARLNKPFPEKIPPAYLDPILADASESKPRRDQSWKQDDNKARSLCRELGIPVSVGNEGYPEFHARIERALLDRERRQVT